MMIPPRVSFPFVVLTKLILFQVIHGKNPPTEQIYECISNRELANIPFHPEHIGTFQTLFDYDRKIIAHRNADKRLCFIQKTNPSSIKIKSRCLNSFQMKYFAGNMIDTFCRGYKPLLVGSATPLSNSVPNDDHMQNEAFERNVDEFMRVRRNADQISNTQNTTPLRGRYRGQTQSQYLNFNGESTPPGRAEAESTPTGSRALVSGNSGMGQAQSQSGFSSGCEDCYGQSSHLTGGRYTPYQDGKIAYGSPTHHSDRGTVGSRYGDEKLSKPVSGYPTTTGTQTSSKYPDGSGIATYPGIRGEPRQDKYSQKPSPGSVPGQSNGYGDRSTYQPTSDRDSFRQTVDTDPTRSTQRQSPDNLGRPNISGQHPVGSQQQPGTTILNRPSSSDRGTYDQPSQEELTNLRQNGYTPYNTEVGRGQDGRYQPIASNVPGTQGIPTSSDGRHLQPGTTQGSPGSSFRHYPGSYLPGVSTSYPTGVQNGYNQNLKPGYPGITPSQYEEDNIGIGGPKTQTGTSVIPPGYYQTLPESGHRKQQGIQSSYQEPQGSRQTSPGSYQQPQGSQQISPGSYQQPQGSQQISPGSYQQPQGPQQISPGSYQQPPGPQQISPGSYQQPQGPHQIPPGSYHQSQGPQQISPGSYQQPQGPQQISPGSYQQPQGSQQISPGTYQQPQGSQQISPGSYQQPQGSQQIPPGSYQLPQGSQQISPGSYQQPQTSHQITPGAYQQPQGSHQRTPGLYQEPSSHYQIPQESYQRTPGTQQGHASYPGGANQIPTTYQESPGPNNIHYHSSLPANQQSTSNVRQEGTHLGTPGSQQYLPDPNQNTYLHGTPIQTPYVSYQQTPQTQSVVPNTQHVLPPYQRIPGTQQISQDVYQNGIKDTSVLQHPYQGAPGLQTRGPQTGFGTNNLGVQSTGQENGNIQQGRYDVGYQHGMQPNQGIPSRESGVYPSTGINQAVPGTVSRENQGLIGISQDSHGTYPDIGSQIVHQGPNVYPGTSSPGTYHPYGTNVRPGTQQYDNERPTQYTSPSDLYNRRNQETQGTGYVQSPYIEGNRPYDGVYPPSQSHISHQWDGHTPGDVEKYSTHEHRGDETISQNVKDEDDDANSQAETSIKQLENGTFASSSSTGVYGGGSAQTQISGTYSGSGSFSAQAQTIEANRGSQSQITAGGTGVTSSAQGRGGRGQSQVQMQMGKEMGETIANAQSTGINHGTNTQVQASSKGGLADAQATGPGSTSSQAQIGFQPQEAEYENSNGEGPFYGGGTASAQSGKYDGQSQTQIQGKFKYGISYTGAAQAGSGLKDGGTTNRTVLKPLNLFGNASPRLDRDAVTKSPVVNTTEESPTEVFEESESNFYDNIQYPTKNENKIQNIISKPNDDYKSSQKYTMNQKQSTSIKGDLSDDYTKGIKDILNVEDFEENESEEEDYDGEFYQSTEMNLNQPREVVVQQTGGNQKQRVILVSTNNNGIHIVKDSSSKDLLQKGMVFQPGEDIPGSQGYTIPIGFRGKVTSVSGSDDTYAFADENGESQAQTITLTPGNRNITFGESIRKNQRGVKSWPSSTSGHNYKVNSNNLRSNYRTDPDYVTVTKSIAGELNKDKTALLEDKKISHTYYTKSSTCGYFTYTCNFVDGSNGRKKFCKPKTPTNPDGTPLKC